MTEQDNSHPGVRILGRYRLSARIGRGRLGDVYEAIDETSLALGAERSVAIQPLDAKLAADEAFVDKLRRGYAALRTGSHPNVVELLDFARDGELRFFMMEFLEGASLRFVIDCVSPLPADEVVALVRGVGDALQYLHAKSMSHGRVTPENVLVTNDYDVKLLDLVPALPASPLPGIGIDGRGPPRAADARDDVFGLACLTYELLGGRHPFNSNSPLEARRAGLEPVPIVSLPDRQWHALLRALALEHEQRTATIGDFLREFGVQGTERLRPEPGARTGPPLKPTAPPARPPVVDRPALHEPGPERMPRRSEAFARGLAFAAAAAVVAGVLLFREPLAEWTDAWTSASETDDERVASRDRQPEPDPEDSDGQAEPGPADREARSIEAPRASPATATLAASRPPAPERQASPLLESELPAPKPISSESPTSTQPTTTALAAEPRPTEREASAPVLAVAEPVLSFREGTAAVQVPLRRGGDTATTDTVVWWTGDRTALADEDYAGIGEQEERFAPGELSLDLYVPLIDDSLPEPAESFLVFVGRYGAAGGPLETIAQVTVDIVDDD